MSNGQRWRVVPIGVWEKFLDLTWNLSFEIEGGRNFDENLKLRMMRIRCIYWILFYTNAGISAGNCEVRN